MIKNAVRLSRIEAGLTQVELAEKIGVTRQTIGLIEKDKYNPTILLALNLSEVLDKSLNALFWLEGKKNEKR